MAAQHAGGAYSTRYKFNGKELDPETGYYYYGARYYDPVVSRWLSIDPLAEKYPALSPYNYTANNPVMLVDPDGKTGETHYFNKKTGEHIYVDDGFDQNIVLVDDKDWSAVKAAQKTKTFLGFSEFYRKGLIKPSIISYLYLQKLNFKYKLNQVIEEGEPISTSLALTTEFISGIGPETRVFNENHPFSKSLKNSNMTTIALKAFYAGYTDYLVGLRSNIPRKYRVDFSYIVGGNTGPIREFISDRKFTSAQFLGTAYYYFNLEGGRLYITVYDTKTMYSFFYHLPGTDRHSRNDLFFMGETTQFYEFSFTIKEIQTRINK